MMQRGLLGVNYARVSLLLDLTITKEGAGKDLDRHPPLASVLDV